MLPECPLPRLLPSWLSLVSCGTPQEMIWRSKGRVLRSVHGPGETNKDVAIVVAPFPRPGTDRVRDHKISFLSRDISIRFCRTQRTRSQTVGHFKHPSEVKLHQFLPPRLSRFILSLNYDKACIDLFWNEGSIYNFWNWERRLGRSMVVFGSDSPESRVLMV